MSFEKLPSPAPIDPKIAEKIRRAGVIDSEIEMLKEKVIFARPEDEKRKLNRRIKYRAEKKEKI